MITVSKNWFKDYYDPYMTRTTIGSRMNDAHAINEVAFIKELFQFQKGESLLDLPCGAGRHSIKLARLGLKVTGLDISPACISLSRNKVSKAIAKRISFDQADIRQLGDYHGQFDYAINMCTSLGYFSTAKENEKALGELARCLRPGGQLLIQIVNRDWLLDCWEQVEWIEANDHFLLSRREYDARTKYLVNNWIFIEKSSGKIRRYPHRLRVYTAPELAAMMRLAGLAKIRRFGDLKFGKLTKECRWMYLTGERQ
jgi:ubiquinone/menaquinone biosynthesis C-methylase UbiE